MKKQLHLTIVTPEKPVLECSGVDSVVMPAYDGEMGILPDHIPGVVQLKEGILRYKTGATEGEFAVMGGFAEIFENKVSVFAEEAELSSEISEERARQALQKAKHILASKTRDTDIETLQAAIRRAAVRIKLAQRRTPPRRTQ